MSTQSSPSLAESHLSTLRHMLGLNDPTRKDPVPYRNYAAVNPGDQQFVELERLGMVRRYRTADDGSCYDWYMCTKAGQEAATSSFYQLRILTPHSRTF